MNNSLPFRLASLVPLAVALALNAAAFAQEPPSKATASPSPSPTPSASPSVDEDALVAEDLEAAVDAARFSADEAGRVTEEAQRATEAAIREAVRSVETTRSTIESRARQAALSMAMADSTRIAASVEARVAAERAFGEAESSYRAMSEAQTPAQDAAREKELAAHEKAREKAREKEAKAREKAREARETARERAEADREWARERAQEAREAARERQREQSESIDDLYEQAMEAIDEEDWSDALGPLSRLMSLNDRVDAALYWSGYAQGKMNRTAAALESLARLQKEFPTSRWAREGRALELEVRGKSGQVPQPDQEDDMDLKLMAVSALAQSDPQEALPVLTRILASPSSSRKVRERSLFVLAQMGSEPAGNAIAEVARGNSSPELQRKAIQYLGVFGGAGNRKILSEVYASTTDNTLRKQILNSFMVSGDKARVLSAAKTEKDPALRADAVRLLGVMGGTTELSQMYGTASSAEEKKAILHALFIGGAVEPVAAAARGEKDKDVRLAAVRNLGLMGRKSQDVLGEMYRTETDPEVKKEVLNAFFLQNNAPRLVEVARTEKEAGLRKEAVHWLSRMNSKEAGAYMLELLKD